MDRAYADDGIEKRNKEQGSEKKNHSRKPENWE